MYTYLLCVLDDDEGVNGEKTIYLQHVERRLVPRGRGGGGETALYFCNTSHPAVFRAQFKYIRFCIIILQ